MPTLKRQRPTRGKNLIGTTLQAYQAKRDFAATPEPSGTVAADSKKPIFVVQEHHASHLHYDFRLEADGVLKSWAIPKGPSLDPGQKRLAVRVEDHPLAYGSFSGTIPEGHYGAGTVVIWDRGTFENLIPGKSVSEGIKAGRLDFRLSGDRLLGRFALVRMKRGGRSKENWLLIKSRDEFAKLDPPDATPRPRHTARSTTRRMTPTAEPPAEAIEVTNGDKVMYPEADITKREVFAYYRRIAPRLLPFLKDRPVTLERCPDGVGEGKTHFWQKNIPVTYPSWLPRIELATERGKTVHYALVNDRSTLLFLVNQGTLTFHAWLSRTSDLDRPDFVLFDLDPGLATFADACVVARRLREELKNKSREVVLKTSGKTGLHLLVPWEGGGYEQSRRWALSIAELVAQALPNRATVEVRKEKRGSRVYIDVLQNARGHHVVPPYVLRAVPGAPVSMPLTWRELREDLNPRIFNLRTALPRLARQRTDPLAPLLAPWKD